MGVGNPFTGAMMFAWHERILKYGDLLTENRLHFGDEPDLFMVVEVPSHYESDYFTILDLQTGSTFRWREKYDWYNSYSFFA